MPKENTNDRFSRIYFMLWGVCLLVALVLFTLYKFGFRLSSELQPVKVGSVEIISPDRDFQLFFDNRERGVIEEDGFFGIRSVTPGVHSLMVSKNDYWPWAKTFRVHANAKRSVSVFFLPVDGIEKIAVALGSAEYRDAIKNIEASKVQYHLDVADPAEDESFSGWLFSNYPDRKLSKDKSTALFVQDNTLYAGWVSDSEPHPFYFCEENPCKFKIPVIVSEDPLKSVAFFGSRRDVALFSAGSTIYAIELDREGTQNFQPVYKGVDPYFYVDENDVLYIKDGNSIQKAKL